MTLPNFFVIGAAKCGTESINSYLSQHPQIYMSPKKETNFFVAEDRPIPFRGPGDQDVLRDYWISSQSEYEAEFSQATTERAIGEASPWYVYLPEVPGRIVRRIQDARFVAILRNPVDRAFSAFCHLRAADREPVGDFAKALAREDRRRSEQWEPLWHYVHQGLYANQIERYYDTFESSRVHVIIYDDFVKQPRIVMRDLTRFLDVDDTFVFDMSRRLNVTQVPKNAFIHALVGRPNLLKDIVKPVLPSSLRRKMKQPVMDRNLGRPSLDPVVRRQLVELFRPDVLDLQDLLHRDLSQWLEVAPKPVSQGA